MTPCSKQAGTGQLFRAPGDTDRQTDRQDIEATHPPLRTDCEAGGGQPEPIVPRHFLSRKFLKIVLGHTGKCRYPVNLRAEILETRSGPASSIEAAEQNLGSQEQLPRQAGLHPPSTFVLFYSLSSKTTGPAVTLHFRENRAFS